MVEGIRKMVCLYLFAAVCKVAQKGLEISKRYPSYKITSF